MPAAEAAAQPMLLPLSQAQQQVTQQRQQQQQSHEQACQGLAVIPTAIVAEMLPLLNRLIREKLMLEESDRGSQRQVRDHSVMPARQTLTNYTSLVTTLLYASAVDLDDSAGSSSTSAASHTATAAARDEVQRALSACGTPAAPCSFLHSQDVYTAHAVDTIAALEGVVRFTHSDGTRTGWDGDFESATHMLTVMTKLTAAAMLLARQAGPAAAVLQQCHSFLASVMKLAECPASLTNCSATTCALGLGPLCYLTTRATASHLWYTIMQTEGSAAVSRSLLPSLVIIGRSFLLAVQQLRLGAATRPILVDMSFSKEEFIGGLVVSSQLWLRENSAQLAAAGYSLEPVLQQLQQLQDALKCRTADSDAASSSMSAEQAPPPPGGSSSSSSSTAAATGSDSVAAVGNSSNSAAATSSITQKHALSVALQELEQAGLALCSLAVPCMCNNPGCSNTSGPTEMSLVSGRSSVCAGCRVAHYCCRAFQTQHWKQHKPVCTALAAAAAAAAAVVAAPK